MRSHTQFNKENSGRLAVNVALPFDYQLRPAANSKPSELILLLHGFAESGERILKKLEPSLPPNAVVLAPDGPFPLPHKTDKGYIMTHSWYLYDPTIKEYFIDMSLAMDFLVAGITQLKLDHLPKRIIGFSQGGYLAPFVAQKLSDVRQLVGIASEYLADELSGPLPPKIDSIHGSIDDVVSIADARTGHEALLRRGASGMFHEIVGSAHRLDENIRRKLQEIL